MPLDRRRLLKLGVALIAPAISIAALPAQAATMAGASLAKALQDGGYVIVMRHASSPQTLPTPDQADPENTDRQRQLDAAGRQSAAAMGEAIRRLHIRIGAVWSSPTYRALETVRLAGLPSPRTAPELGDHGRSMQSVGDDQGAWLRARADQPPRPDSDTLIVTHSPNITAAFGEAAAGLRDGEAMVFRPSLNGPPELVARIRIEDWAGLAGS